MITAERVRELLSYDPSSGEFAWKVSRGTARAGRIAGALDSHGYRQISIDSRLRLAHRLAWLYVHGVWPEREIDHINGGYDDNRLCNLRLATRNQNQANRPVRRDNLSRLKAVHEYRPGHWRARITVNGKRRHIGVFATPDDAHRAYAETAAKDFGTFARLS
jgi:hypothetical protein